MTTLTNTLRPYLDSCCPSGRSLMLPSLTVNEVQERQVVFAFALALCVGAAALVVHALGVVTAFS